jgi:hypothetical protein
MLLRNFFVFNILLLSINSAWANERIGTTNTLVWLNNFHTIHLNTHWSIAAEYQWRRTEGLQQWQQSLLRGGVQYKINAKVQALIGYGWIETYPYGAFPPAIHQPFPEHRIYEQLTWTESTGRLQLQHRIRLEQRMLGQLNPSTPQERNVAQWNWLHRVRYQLKFIYPINNKSMLDKTFYASAYDELFIGFGNKVGANVFDQNRLGLGLGYKWNKRIALEAVYFNQTLQQARKVNDKSVFQYNNGIAINAVFNWNN